MAPRPRPAFGPSQRPAEGVKWLRLAWEDGVDAAALALAAVLLRGEAETAYPTEAEVERLPDRSRGAVEQAPVSAILGRHAGQMPRLHRLCFPG
jgi:hypothetical protein